MKMLILASAFTTALLLLTCRCSAQGAAPAPASAAQEYLEAHNQARAAVGVGPLRWSEALTKSADLTTRMQRDRNNCSFADLSKSRYGGNQLWAGGVEVTPRVAVETWLEEKKFYNYADNSCQEDHRCGVYTQVVWKKTTEVGCAQAKCPKDRSSLTICFYTPPGNVVGEKPY